MAMKHLDASVNYAVRGEVTAWDEVPEEVGNSECLCPLIFATTLIAQRYETFAYFLPILRTNSRQRRTSQGKCEQLTNHWEKR